MLSGKCSEGRYHPSLCHTVGNNTNDVFYPIVHMSAHNTPLALIMGSKILAQANLQVRPQTYDCVSWKMPLILYANWLRE